MIPEGAAWHQQMLPEVVVHVLCQVALHQCKKVRAGHQGVAYATGKGSKREFIVDLCCGTVTLVTLFHLLRSLHMFVLGVNCNCNEAWVWEHLPASVQDRFVF